MKTIIYVLNLILIAIEATYKNCLQSRLLSKYKRLSSK
jgi:hypothetical protein